ncbi:MAG: hypothetical protein QS721_05610 [Candidatus Endonucleobacter sp. (ex Gigantidas childressi)]|nr:hypothetical protein [Candidatus Endonucleobacter sp. (ex Gigantidas childressi)]
MNNYFCRTSNLILSPLTVKGVWLLTGITHSNNLLLVGMGLRLHLLQAPSMVTGIED